MKILLIDTCGLSGSIALADTEPAAAVVAMEMLPNRSASERLVPAIKNLFASLGGQDIADLGAVAVVHGPGSFTGVRVGLSAAKGLCEALGLPLIAVSRLAVLASLIGRVERRVFAALDAGRGEFYLGEFMDGICLREALLTLTEVLSVVEGGAISIVVCEEGVAGSLAVLSPELVAEPVASDALPLVFRRIAEGSYDDVVGIDANYLRRTDAEIFAKPRAVPMPTSEPYSG